MIATAKFGGSCLLKSTANFDDVRSCNTVTCNWWHRKAYAWSIEGEKTGQHVYDVEYRTGTNDASGSTSEMRIKFAGTRGASKSYSLGSSFSRGEKGVKRLVLNEDVGLLHQIELIAHGPDGWNPVDFINVHTPDKQIVQFRADFVLTTVHSTGLLLDGVYASKHSVRETAIIPQEARAPESKAYVVNYETGGKTGTSSPMFVQPNESPMFVQLIGATGETRFYELGDSFTVGQTGFASLQVSEHIGLLTGISLEAGGRSSWTPSGAILVTTPSSQVISFNADGVCIAEQFPVGAITTSLHKGRNYEVTQIAYDSVLQSNGHHEHCYHRRMFKAVKPETHPVAKKGMEERLFGEAHADQGPFGKRTLEPTRAPTKREDPMLMMKTLDYSHKEGDAGGLANGVNSANTALPTGAPTASPTVPWCAYGQRSVPDGWKGAGPENQYCNLCHCKKGLMWCGQRTCGIPFGGIDNLMPTGTKKCSHTKCAGTVGAAALVTAKDAAKVVNVHHHHAEQNGDGHRCAFNKYSNVCTCFCWTSTDATPAPQYLEFTTGKQKLEFVGGYRAQHCESVSFSEGQFNAAKGPVRVLVSTTASAAPSFAYVEASDLKGFRACVHTSSAMDQNILLNYHAWQGTFPFDRERRAAQLVQAGHTKLHSTGPHRSLTPGTTQCKVVTFEKPFAAEVTPIILGGVDRNGTMHEQGLMAKMASDGDNTHVPLTYWIENVNRIEFKVSV
jgi:hypothetical protein